MKALLLASLLLLSGAACAQDLPQTQPPNNPSCNHETPSALFRQTYSGPGQGIECLRKWSAVGGPARWPDASVSLTNEEKKFGFAVTGGGCEQVAPQCNYAMVMSKPLSDDGWYCRTGDNPGDSAASEKRVQAYLVACRIVQTRKPLDGAVAMDTAAAGDLITIARRGSGLEKTLRLDYRICNLEPADSKFSLDIWWTVAGSQDRPKQQLAPQRCLNASGVSSLMLRNVATQAKGLRFSYQRFPRNSFASCDSKECSTDFLPTTQDNAPPIAAGQEKSLTCSDVSTPGVPPSKWIRSCALPLSDWGHYRICYDKAPFTVKGQQASWPGAFALLVVNDKKLITTAPFPQYPGDARWNEAIEPSCTDIYDVNHAWIAIGSDPNYSAKDVSGVKIRIQTLTGPSGGK